MKSRGERNPSPQENRRPKNLEESSPKNPKKKKSTRALLTRLDVRAFDGVLVDLIRNSEYNETNATLQAVRSLYRNHFRDYL